MELFRKTKSFWMLTSSFVLALALLLSVCGPFAGEPVRADAASVKLNKTKLSLSVGSTYTLKVSGTTQTVTWSSSKKSVATVSTKGRVKAVSEGTATITAKVGSKSLTCKVTVTKPVYKVESRIDGSTIECEAGSTVTRVLYEKSSSPYDEEPGLLLPEISGYSGGEAELVGRSVYPDGTYWNSYYKIVCTTSEVKELVRDYIELLEEYGFTFGEKKDSTGSIYTYGYGILENYYLTYNGAESITKGRFENYTKEKGYVQYDLDISVYAKTTASSITIAISTPNEVGYCDTGERRDGTAQAAAAVESSLTSYTADASMGASGDYDVFYFEGWGEKDDYISLSFKNGEYSKGDVFDFTSDEVGKGISYTILATNIVGDDIYNYIKPGTNAYMIELMEAKIIKKTTDTTVVSLYLVIKNDCADRYVIEAVTAYSAQVKKNKASNFEYKASGEKLTLKNGSLTEVSDGAAYTMYVGDTVTLASPDGDAGIGCEYYVYSFIEGKEGIVDISSSSDLYYADITAKKAGTVYVKVSFYGTKKVKKLSGYSMGGQWISSSYYVYESDMSSEVIKLTIKKK